jgi:hypothetical protein
VKNREINFWDYVNCLTTEEPKNVAQKGFKSRKHVFTATVNKVGLSCEDDKQIILKDKENTLVRGHWRFKTKMKISGFQNLE